MEGIRAKRAERSGDAARERQPMVRVSEAEAGAAEANRLGGTSQNAAGGKDPPALPTGSRAGTPPRQRDQATDRSQMGTSPRQRDQAAEQVQVAERTESTDRRQTRSRSHLKKMRRMLSSQDVVSGQWRSDWSPAARAPLKGHNKVRVVSVCVYENDSLAVSCGEDGKLLRHNLRTGAQVGEELNHEGPTTDCCVCPDEKIALSCGKDGTLRVWCLQTSELKRTIQTKHTKTITACCFLPLPTDEQQPTNEQQQHAVTASEDGTLEVWNIEADSQSPVHKLMADAAAENSPIHSCHAFISAAGGKWAGQRHVLSGGADNSVRRWDLSDLYFKNDEAGSAEFEAGARRQIVHKNGSAWLAKSDAVRGKLGHSGIVHCVVVSEDATRALSCGGDRKAICWDLTTGEPLQVLTDAQSGAAMYCCCFLQPSNLAMTVSAFAPRVWDVHSGELLRTFCGHTGEVLACRALRSGEKALTCGMKGTIRVWDLLQKPNVAEMPMPDTDGPSNVVKDLCMLEGPGLRALSCSYDHSVRVWDLRLGECVSVLEGHKGKVNQCCVFPGEETKMVLTASSDGTIKVWELASRESEPSSCLLTLGKNEHSGKEVRGCGVFSGGSKVYSCSKDTTICIFELKCDENERPVEGVLHKQLKGHTALVDRCCVYCKDTRMISASWDKTCKVWDISGGSDTGTELKTLDDDNKVRGVVVYADDTRAVTAGSGLWLRIWDLDRLEQLQQVCMNHRGTVWGLAMVNKAQRLRDGAAWIHAPVLATYGNDGVIKMWNLSDGAAREIIHGRRAVHPSPMSVAVLPESYKDGQLAILVGALQSIKLIDCSHLGTGPSAGAIWDSKACIEPTVWMDWLVEAIEEESAHFLYAHQGDIGLPTMIHKLAEDDKGHHVLQKVIGHYAKQRATILQGQPFNPLEPGQIQALSTVGMLSRSGGSIHGFAIAIATRHAFEDMAELLLSDYRDHVTAFNHSSAATSAASTSKIHELAEEDLVHLFSTFPRIAAEFLEGLPLVSTNLVSSTSRCIFTGARQHIIRASFEHSPHVGQFEDESFAQWWEPVIDEMWERNQDVRKEPFCGRCCKFCSGLPNGLDRDIDSGNRDLQRRHENRLKDKTWGVKVASYRIPIIAGKCKIKKDLTQQMTESRKDSQGSDRQRFRRDSMRILTDNLHERWDLFGHLMDNESLDYSMPPFSFLLRACCEHAEKGGSSDVFCSPTLRAIIQYKWRIGAWIFRVQAAGYFVHLLCLTFVTLRFEQWTVRAHEDWLHVAASPESDEHGHFYVTDDDGYAEKSEWGVETDDGATGNGSLVSPGPPLGGQSPAGAVIAWVLFSYCALYNLLLMRHEYVQFMKESKKYLKDWWNYLDISAAVLTEYTLVHVAVLSLVTKHDDATAGNAILRGKLDNVQAHALLLSWLKLLYFLRGHTSYAFEIRMLSAIWVDMKAFLLILLVVVVAFGTTFFLMLRHDRAPPPYPEETMFRNEEDVLTGVFGMIFGEMPINEFADVGVAAQLDFVAFLIIVPLIMLNALIAIMSNTYEKIKQEDEQTRLRDRAMLLLEYEQCLMRYSDTCMQDSAKNNEVSEFWGLPKAWTFVMRTLSSLAMTYTEYPTHLHKLSARPTQMDARGTAEHDVRLLTTSMRHLRDDMHAGNVRAQRAKDDTLDRIRTLENRMGAMEANVTQKLDEVMDLLQRQVQGD